MDIAYKIKTLRQQKGLSQEELALKSNLSLRTIQRIELNETMPRGYTLNNIAEALDTTYEKLISNKTTSGNSVILIHVSAFSFILFPLLGFLLPLIIWAVKKDRWDDEDDAARKLLNFQATWCILLFILCASGFNGKFFHIGKLGRPEVMMICILFMYVINFICIIINIILAVRSKKAFYQPAIPLFKSFS
ncbi:DUF4870 domain-containing protein [Pedobacter psychrotolerans]|uniref:DUF4870 domain-containing protein n=1 Tax=Pedobacter psychrotolerans TaxID=1843235 RepID=UPI003F98A1EB